MLEYLLSPVQKVASEAGWRDEMKFVSRQVVLASMAAVLLPSFAACATSLKWTEGVKLPDGRIVTLTRYQEFRGPHELG
jgi:hypothetical protein